MKKILLIDDEKEILDTVSEMLAPHQFQSLLATNGRDGIQIAVKEQPDVIVLDVNMPEMDGFDVCRRLKDQPGTRHIPVIMLTRSNGLDSRVKGLDFGADDYVAKPFQSRELVARINARLRRHEIEKKADQEIVIGNLRILPKSLQVWVNQIEVRLTKIEYALLKYFAERPNEVVDRSKLLSDLWPDAVVTHRTVDTHMANLRKKIRGFTHPFDTIYGAGYILRNFPKSEI